ncbi:MAG: hypothetical protein GTO14_23205 [Anaerolineales bacterium]|nr:hypothetical protein [Anaerolineales bacterium]
MAGAVVFTHWKGRNVLRRLAVPANPRSVGQLSVRAMMRFLSQNWSGLTSAEQNDWLTRAAATNISAFNAYCSYNMGRWGTNRLPSKLDPAAEDDTAGVISTPVGTAGSRSVLVGCTVDTLNQNWGLLFFRGTSAGIGVTRNEMVHAMLADSAAAFTWLDFPLTVGTTYYYRAYGFSEAGVIGNALDEWSATPTA